jgi:Metallo-peptidase family M12B Reprolysin-like
MNLKIKAAVIMMTLWVAQAHAIVLTPNDIGGGNIPGNQSVIDFNLSDGNWTRNIYLPKQAPDRAVLTIKSAATFGSSIELKYTDIPISSLSLQAGESQKFEYSAAQGRWLALSIPEYSPKTVASVPASLKLWRYQLSDADWAPSVTLPATAPAGAVVLVQSKAQKASRITAGSSVLHASTMNLSKGQAAYAFTFHPELKKWYLVNAPIHRLVPSQLNAGATIPAPITPRVILTMLKGASGSIGLPAAAGDRDRIRIDTAAALPITIRNTGINYAGTLRMQGQDVYEFMWIAEKTRWEPLIMPRRYFSLGSLPRGVLPAIDAPKVTVAASNASWAPQLTLPAGAKTGDRVLVSSSATSSFQVVSAAVPSPALRTVSSGDEVSFVVDANQRWQVETGIITMLQVYSDTVANRLGEQAARARQLESFRITNEALENSRANFKLKLAGLFRHRDQGSTLNDAVDRLRSDAVVQAERNRVKADAIYYEGAEDGCGLAWLNSNDFNMVATGSINCGTIVMRHEFGHNMGLSHGGSPGGSAPYATGYTLFSTIMGGNSTPFYSNPRIYQPEVGLPLGIEDKIDAVRAMNERSSTVANFR